jgi:hypothetical protein
MSHLTARQLYLMLAKRGFSDIRATVALERVQSPYHAFLVLNALTRRMPGIFSALFVESDAFALGCRQVAIASGGIPNYVDLMKWLREGDRVTIICRGEPGALRPAVRKEGFSKSLSHSSFAVEACCRNSPSISLHAA